MLPLIPLLGTELMSQNYMLRIKVPSWVYVCLDLDLPARRLDVYVDDKKLEAISSQYTRSWDKITSESLKLTRLSIHNEKVGIVNLFNEPFRAGTCGQNGTLVAWPLMLNAMQPMGTNKMSLAAICSKDQSYLVYVPFRTSFDIARENCHKMKHGGHFPIYSSMEARDIVCLLLLKSHHKQLLHNMEKDCLLLLAGEKVAHFFESGVRGGHIFLKFVNIITGQLLIVHPFDPNLQLKFLSFLKREKRFWSIFFQLPVFSPLPLPSV